MFFIVASLVLLLMALFVTRVLLNISRWFSYGIFIFLLMFLAVAARISIAIVGHSAVLTFAAWLGYSTIGIVSLLFVAAAVKLGFSVLGYSIAKATPKFSPSRRIFLSKTVGVTLSTAVAPMAVYGVYRAVGEPVVKDVRVDSSNTPEGLKGFKIVQLTDVHTGPTIDGEKVQSIVEIANSLNPDIVVITGDMVDGSAKFIADYVKPLSELKSTHGSYFVTGNHEYYSGADAWIRLMEKNRIKVLNNSNEILSHKGANLMVAGIPDIHSEMFGHEKYNPAKAKLTDKHYDYSIILSHRPEIADEISKYGYDLQLSGHTHGGQYFPWTFAIHLVHRYVRGLYDVNGMKLYVSQGTAYWGPPLRIGAESEITLLTL